jgi:hypothetical protein
LRRKAISSIIFASHDASQRLLPSKTALLVDRDRNLSGAKLLIEDSTNMSGLS